MLAFEALSFGLKTPEEETRGQQQAMDFGVCVGEGAAVVCRWKSCGTMVAVITTICCYGNNTVYVENGSL
jgi:hypothetical protein